MKLFVRHVLVGIVAMCACHGPEPVARTSTVLVMDSAGITIVDNGDLDPGELWSLDSVPAVTLGGIEEYGGRPLFSVSSGTRLPGGRIAIADAGSLEVLVYSDSGQFISSAGGQGGGPGEFGALGGITVVATSTDSIIVDEGWLARRQRNVYTVDGQFVRDVAAASLRTMRGAWYDIVSSPAGDLFAVAELDDDEALTPGVRRRTARVIRIEAGATNTDTVAMYPGSAYFYADVGPMPAFGGGTVAGPRSIGPLFAPRSVLAGGGTPFVVAAGDQAIPAYDVYDSTGKLLRRVRWSARARQPTTEDVDSAAAAYRRAWRIDPRGAERAVAKMPRVDRTPEYRRLVVDRTGHVWVQRYPLPSDERGEWWVFAPDGTFRSTVSTPRNGQILEAGYDYVLVLAHDELDVERVESWPLTRNQTRIAELK